MEPSVEIQLQYAIVVEAANCIAAPWDIAVVNIEIDTIEGERVEDCLALIFRAKAAWLPWRRKLARDSFQVSMKCLDHFVELWESSQATKPWKTCTLEFQPSGQYKFSYSYEPPSRLNGDFGSDAMLEGYVPQI
jgi:hypothetical protein